MAKHIHIWLRGSTRDADGPAHVPAGSSKGGQFTSGSGGGGAKVVPGHSASANKSAKAQPKNLVNNATPAMQKEAAERKANGGGSKADVAGFMSRVAKKTPSPAPSSKVAPAKTETERKANGGGSKADVAGFMSRVAKKTPSPAPSSKADQAKANARKENAASATEKAAAFKALEKHPNYHKEDLTYLKDKGYDPEEIKVIWDRDQKAGHGPQTKNKYLM